MYWSDCSGPATIQSARIVDGQDRQTLIIDDQHRCITDIAIDFDSTYFSIFVNATVKLNSFVSTIVVAAASISISVIK